MLNKCAYLCIYFFGTHNTIHTYFSSLVLVHIVDFAEFAFTATATHTAALKSPVCRHMAGKVCTMH
jgi:hypothetical protein